MSWHTAVVEGVGPCVFEVLGGDHDSIQIQHVTGVQAVADQSGRVGAQFFPYPIERLGYSAGALKIQRDRLGLFGDASQEGIDGAERAWGLRQIETPNNRLVVPGGNGPR